ncbi:MAG TPA: competence/damage-inducible protein A [Bacteroidales bacterium]|nr:competence/damage-inducible protein A [Bacteroidales bacterium]
MNTAEIITIGDELLIGQTVDTNSAWMGAELSKNGIRVNRITSISDNRKEIISALDEAMSRADIILITGGLGPTSDDITKETLNDYFGGKMVISEEVLEEITERLRRRNFPMNENNRMQALVPDTCMVLRNKAGTAPGMLFRKGEEAVISMPGVPNEMKYIMKEHILPMLSGQYRGNFIIHKNIMTFGTFEALLAERLEVFERELPGEIKLAYLPAQGIIKLRLTATGNDEKRISGLVDQQVEKLYEILPDVIYGEDEVSLEEVIGNLLSDSGLNVSTAESCTGGKIASLITSVAGSSGWYKGSVIAYDNSIKEDILGVNRKIITSRGAVSRETAAAMAEGVRRLMGTDFAVAVTGIAGPTGGTPEKPVGTVWIAVASEKGTVTEKQTFGADRLINISRSSNYALNLLRKQIISY